MSRIGKLPVSIPSGVQVKMDGRKIELQGPKGSLSLDLHEKLVFKQEDEVITVTPKNIEDSEALALWGTFQRLISNMVTGVTEGFSKILEFTGVGWRMEVKGKTLVMHVGYSHPVEYRFPDNINISVEKNVITISGADKQQVGQIASEIRAKRKPEPYKGKGIKYQTEVIKRKAGKQAKSAA